MRLLPRCEDVIHCRHDVVTRGASANRRHAAPLGAVRQFARSRSPRSVTQLFHFIPSASGANCPIIGRIMNAKAAITAERLTTYPL